MAVDNKHSTKLDTISHTKKNLIEKGASCGASWQILTKGKWDNHNNALP